MFIEALSTSAKHMKAIDEQFKITVTCIHCNTIQPLKQKKIMLFATNGGT
jgi:hypothetical protein